MLPGTLGIDQRVRGKNRAAALPLALALVLALLILSPSEASASSAVACDYQVEIIKPHGKGKKAGTLKVTFKVTKLLSKGRHTRIFCRYSNKAVTKVLRVDKKQLRHLRKGVRAKLRMVDARGFYRKPVNGRRWWHYRYWSFQSVLPRPTPS